MSLANTKGVIWYDGDLVPWDEAKTHVLSHTLHYGMGVFEGVRAYNTAKGPSIFRLKAHTERLFRSAHIMNMAIPFSYDQLERAQQAVIKENGLSEAYLRPMCFYGPGQLGLRTKNLKTHCIVAAWKWPSYLSSEALEKGIKIRTSSYVRHHVNTTLCKAKANGNYMNSMLALREAIDSGCEEALLLDSEGYVAEGSGQNIFIVKADGILYTPQLTSCLEGITRDTVMYFAKEIGLEVRETCLTRDDVYIAKEAFFTGTATEIMPIREHDGRIIGTGKPGPITRKLQKMYFDQVCDRQAVNPEWLTLVNNSATEIDSHIKLF
ncbi:MAG: branched-chain amino acid transaminase [Endozoicomonas sp. (ex Botrylloides leachii)]|nr:branched-chain amino acid transaminase [Endozoicomonas sp. (ex Botrylloides leachii)]